MDNELMLAAIDEELKSICERYSLPYIIADNIITEGKYYPSEVDDIHNLLRKYNLSWIYYEGSIKEYCFIGGEYTSIDGKPRFVNDEPICWDKEQ